MEIASSTSLDVLEIDGASNNGVEQVREIIEASRYAPSRDRFKIYIIDEVHMLTTPAFNALLKTLEEPPPRVKFIFATTEYHKIPDTIVSRCQQFEFRTVPRPIISDQLRKIAQHEGIEIGDAAVSQIARAAEGSLRDALSALDQVLAAVGTKIEEKDVAELLGLIDHQVLAEAARAIMDRRTGAILSIVDELVRGGRDLRSFTRGLIQYFRDLLVVRAAPDSPELVELAGDRQELDELSSRLSEDDLIRSIDSAYASGRCTPLGSRAALSPGSRTPEVGATSGARFFRGLTGPFRSPRVGKRPFSGNGWHSEAWGSQARAEKTYRAGQSTQGSIEVCCFTRNRSQDGNVGGSKERRTIDPCARNAPHR